MFSSHPLLITGGNFTQINDVRPIHTTSLDRLLKSVSPAAFHNSGERRDPPKCHPNTRVAILKKLKEWILGLDPMTRSALIKWLHGPAGSGKSAIAQTLADWAFEEEILLASYFFSRFDSTRNHPRSLIATIAYQAGAHFSEVRENILAAIDADPLIFTRSLMTQIRSLIVEPLNFLITAGYFENPKSMRLIIIDGLDECEDRDGQVDIIRTISKTLQDNHLPLIFLIASRPEHDITLFFCSGYPMEVTSRFPLDDRYKPSSDIKLFLQSEFIEIKENHPFKMQLPPEWPGPQTLEKLVTKSSGQFIYAATVAKFVRSTRHNPAHRLEMVLGLRTPVGDRELPFSELDALYHHVFAGVEDIGLVLKVLSFCLLASRDFPPTVSYIERILSLNRGDISTALCDLHAVLVLLPWSTQPDRELRLHFLHASLEDFLLDKSRSEALYIDPPNRHAEFAQAIFHFFPNPVSAFDIGVCAHHLERASPSETLRHQILNLDTTGIFRFLESGMYESTYSSLERLWKSIMCSLLLAIF
ncbi:hypothetical protein GALMADRAFT_452508 [Galerina marginata CBS 339.88]|uniref:Nephrocystin 3-like N-terminal domain-containing protein n=1 Tax=Galerina marginata (strain CBS 339.88) TaxID=685588 RepID=A0A067TCA8_GALM3|nr:hypothetical protein GALMADRAFT_452508 [Galerina marginata CBS 339.88]